MNVVVAFLLAIGLGVSVALIVAGGRNVDGTGNNSGTDGQERTTGSKAGPTDTGRSPDATLPPFESTASGLSELSGLVFPADMAEFRSAANPNNKQVDIGFSVPSPSAARFIEESGLPPVADGERLLLHGSPLWDLNPDAESKVSSTEDDRGKVHRTVEFVSDPTDSAAPVQVRISLTPAG